MGNRDLDEMIEQYKREMMSLSQKGVDFASATAEEPAAVAAMAVAEKKNKTKTEELTEKEKIKVKEEITIEKQVATDGTDMLQNMNNTCLLNGENPSGKNCTDLNEFLTENSESGTMSVDVYAWDSEFGVNSAKVIVMAPLKSGNVICFNGFTDANGKTGAFRLPAPPKKYSVTQGGNAARFAAYTVLVEHPGYRRALFTNVPVFPGVQSVQPVNLFADVEGTDKNGNADSVVPEPEL